MTTKEMQRVHKGLKKSFGKVREELDNHLDSINMNSSEIQGVYEFLMTLEKKMDKLRERIEELQISEALDVSNITIEELSLREQEVFLALYSSEIPLSMKQLSEQLGFSGDAVGKYVTGMMVKGVPVLRHSHVDGVFVGLELKFKELQAKHNIVQIDSRISQQLLSEWVI